MAQKYSTHRIVSCIDCPYTGAPCGPGLALLQKLNAAVAQSNAVLTAEFEISGTVETAGCSRICTLGFCARVDGASVFGDTGARIETAVLDGALQ